MVAGKFITLEGGEGAGKSTQAQMLAEALREHGLEVVLTREPGGTPGAEAIRELLLHATDTAWNPRAEALLFAAARSDHVEHLICPALARGAWVISDRFIDSSRAYQGGASGLDDAEIMELHDVGSQGLLPHCTLLIEVSPATALVRLSARDGGISDAIGGRDAAYHTRVAAAFSQFAEAEPERFVRIDGNGSAESTQKQVFNAIYPLLNGPS